MKIPRKEVDRLLAMAGEDAPKGKAVTRPNAMNRGERLYAEHLAAMQRAGEILRWDREPEALRLAERCVYWPDFRVIHLDGSVEFREVKGRKGDGFWAKEDAIIKIKVAAAIHPYRFLIVWPAVGGGWHEKVV